MVSGCDSGVLPVGSSILHCFSNKAEKDHSIQPNNCFASLRGGTTSLQWVTVMVLGKVNETQRLGKEFIRVCLTLMLSLLMICLKSIPMLIVYANALDNACFTVDLG